MLNVRSGRKTRATIALSLVATLAPCAIALNRSLDVSQYAHTAWKAGQGFSPGVISSIAQTPDGYLWLGTEFGLRRFDGVRSVPWQATAGEHLAEVPIRSLRAARDGRLWIGTLTGLASWKDGKLTHYPELDGYTVEALLEDREGTIWAGAWAADIGRLCTIQNGKTQCYGEDDRFGTGVTLLYEDSRGNVWAAGTTGLWRCKPGPPKFYGIGDAAHPILALVESDDGGILIARHDGIIKLRNGRAEAYSLPAGMNIRPQRLFRDRDGGLWIGAAVDFGLFHVHERMMDQFGPPQGLSGSAVMCIFEDREGSVWVATGDGLDRFRDFAIPTYSVEQGLASYGLDSVLSTRDGSLWLGTSHGLNRLNQGQITVYRKRSEKNSRGAAQTSGFGVGSKALPSRTAREIIDPGFPEEELITTLFEDKAGKIWVANVTGVSFFESGRFTPVPSLPPGAVFSITDDPAGNVWLAHEEGLFRVFGGRVVERIPWAKLGRKKPANALLHDDAQGGLWLGFLEGGVAYFQDGQVRTSYGQREGLTEGMVYGFSVDGNGALWAATEGGLSRIKDGRVLTLSGRNGLPCNTVQWMREDDFHSVWVNLPCGLVRIARSELDAWASHPERTIQTTVFDSSDGVKSHRVHSGYDAMVNAIVTKAADGRLWFVPFGGVSVIDPHSLHENKLPPPVHIEQVVPNDKPSNAANGMRLPPRVRNLAIDYSALSLVVPEKVRFRVKLEGQDKDWRELVNVRHVEYTNLPPKHYRFRVLACNNSGVWNEEGASLDFVIPPMWYQTNWFYALCAAAFMALLWAAYQLRVRQLAHQFNMRLEERVSERTRVARDLHDTLLQSVQALLPSLQAGINMLATRPADARKVLEDTADHASQAIAEGRDAVQGLRMSTVEKNDLAVAIRTVGEELASAASAPSSPNFNVVVEGASRNLHPILRDEVYRLATEALRNAFRHAAAQNIEVEIRYDEKYFRLRIRDNGKGIPSDVLSGDGRKGHYGLSGMRERAKLVGGKLAIWTEMDGGTEIELTIPGARAYVKSTRTFWHFGKHSATETDEKEPIERE
jgi:signal transduction histidine kinase/ligand-binding sensor domain-containing protein